MAHSSLAATPLSHNDIIGLTQLFQRAFHYHRYRVNRHQETNWKNFLREIRTVVGLGFTATLVEGDLVELYSSDLAAFLENQTFINSCSNHLSLAKAFANMVCLGSDFFRYLDYPEYYKDFLWSLRRCLLHITDEAGIKAPVKAENIINLIMG